MDDIRGNRSIARKLVIYIVIFSSFVTLVMTSINLYTDYHSEIIRIDHQLELVKNSNLESLSNSLWITDMEQVRIQLEGILRYQDMEYVEIISQKKIIIALGTIQEADTIERHFPLTFNYNNKKNELGTLRLVVSLEGVYQRLWDKLLVILITQTIKTFFVSGFIFLIVQYLFTRHLSRIAIYAQRLNVNNLDTPLQLSRKESDTKIDEFGQVSKALNLMRTNLKDSYEELQKEIVIRKRAFDASSRFVPHQFLDHLSKQSILDIQVGECIEKNISVLFSDIRSFTNFSEDMTPQELFNFLNSYLKRMNEVIHRNNGFIDKFIGDGIMALFDHPQVNANNSVHSAISMIDAVNTYNQKLSTHNYDPISIGIGIHTGSVMMGTIGSHERMDTTVLGDAVNLAARLESLTKYYNSQIIISSETYQLIEHDASFLCRELDCITVKGKKEPTNIIEVYNSDSEEIRDKKRCIHQNYHEGKINFYTQKWKQALALFDECLKIYPGDKVTKIYISRCQEFIEQPPSKNWDGVFKMTNK